MDALASGDWLTRERVRFVALACLATTMASIAWLFGGASGTLDALGRPLGTDYSQVWTAGGMALDGRAAEVWSWPAHFAVQQQFHGSGEVDVYGWHYPPPFLLLAAMLATLPYVPALVLWQAATLAGLAALVRRIAGEPGALLLTLAAPVAMICIAHGHNGFLTGLLLGGGLLLLDRRPFAAGLLLGCLLYKPQFALLIPPLLLVTGNWRAISGAICSAALLIALTLALWGWPVWQAFIDSLPLTRAVVIEAGQTGWHKIMSPFAALRSWGAVLPLAYAVQGAVSAAAVSATLWAAFRSRPAVRNAAACAAAILSTPYVLDYDLVLLGVGSAFLYADSRENGWRAWDKSLLAFVWIAPLFARTVAEWTLLPAGLASAAALFAVAMRRVTASPSRRLRAAFAR